MNYSFNYIMLLLLLILSVYYDTTQRKIPNRITMPAILIGVIWSTINGGLDGFLYSVFGFLIGFAIFFIPYVLGGIGAGDVKLMASIGALMGWVFTMQTALAAALVGGIMVLTYMAYKKELGNTLLKALGMVVLPIAKKIYQKTFSPKMNRIIQYFEKNKTMENPVYIPYAVAIAAGSILVLFGAFENF